MDKTSAPSLLPILRSQQQGEILALLLDDPTLELTLTQIAEKSAVPYASVHREIERAENAGILRSRRIGNSRLVQANTDSPYFNGLSDIIVKAFGPPARLSTALSAVQGIAQAFLFGSWAARFLNVSGNRPVGDIDVLVLGDPDRPALYQSLHDEEIRLGREIQVVIRATDWLETGTGTFHDTIVRRPVVEIAITQEDKATEGSTQETSE